MELILTLVMLVLIGKATLAVLWIGLQGLWEFMCLAMLALIGLAVVAVIT